MSISNLAVCFGPTLLRPEEDTMAAIIDIKFCNTVVETLIRNYDAVRAPLELGEWCRRAFCVVLRGVAQCCLVWSLIRGVVMCFAGGTFYRHCLGLPWASRACM